MCASSLFCPSPCVRSVFVLFLSVPILAVTPAYTIAGWQLIQTEIRKEKEGAKGIYGRVVEVRYEEERIDKRAQLTKNGQADGQMAPLLCYFGGGSSSSSKVLWYTDMQWTEEEG